ncbi:hypothetical protein H0A61_02444 [Koleobacter methoxysyntrophicus]|uniref:Uncharacterized protein n=1 Tax=Koleobacter methoxysyntrophicus TaxID=2751313 RepID=A0A8A0RQ67_9FIRM|nr:hypothetical protein [Thermosediminibacterales bacterium]MDK2901432.1 hypothetical protein [Thermosediminibacterales bacterium]QSQ10052.1 hypothetical protein H0A61_02444 [Koleobacter methoxysyntrophicus]
MKLEYNEKYAIMIDGFINGRWRSILVSIIFPEGGAKNPS